MILLIDGNSIGYANQMATRLTVGSFETQAIYGTLKSLSLLASTHTAADMLVLWDGRAQWRFDLYPDYKGNRKDDDPKKVAMKSSYEKQKPILQRAISSLGIRQVTCFTLEADDLAGYFSRKLSENRFVLLVSGDQDWLQLVSLDVEWYDPIRDRRVGMMNFLEATGYHSPREFLEGKALIGDSSDNIKGAGGIGEKGAPLFLAEFKSVEEFWRRCDAGEFKPKKKAHVGLYQGEGRKNFERNLKLMNLMNAPRPKANELKVDPGSYNEADFRKICERLAFASILRDFEAFVYPFRKRFAKAA